MSFVRPDRALDYFPCRYGDCPTTFRGPAAPASAGVIAVIGGSEVFGKYVEDPFCDQLAERLNRPVMNLGIVNGGIDAFVHDEALLTLLGDTAEVIVQAMGAANLSNRFYTVHPRRNDRFLRHSAMLGSLFPQVDFSDFTFVRHMLSTLKGADPVAFDHVRQELRAAWIARMRLLLSRIPVRKTLLCLERPATGPLGAEPLFVDREMLQVVDRLVDRVVRCELDQLGPGDLNRMIFGQRERPAAERSIGPQSHDRVADILAGMMEGDDERD